MTNSDVRADEIQYAERSLYEQRILALEMAMIAARRSLVPFATRACGWEQNHAYHGADSQQISHRLGDFREARTALESIDKYLEKDTSNEG